MTRDIRPGSKGISRNAGARIRLRADKDPCVTLARYALALQIASRQGRHALRTLRIVDRSVDFARDRKRTLSRGVIRLVFVTRHAYPSSAGTADEAERVDSFDERAQSEFVLESPTTPRFAARPHGRAFRPSGLRFVAQDLRREYPEGDNPALSSKTDCGNDRTHRHLHRIQHQPARDPHA
jgi:hypothetical protein